MKAYFVVVMGVSGCGKSSVGRALANHLSWDFYDADVFHPPENIVKMTNGIPLTDSDRAPWLDSLHQLIASNLKADKSGVLACSGLKESYRRHLIGSEHTVLIVYLKGTFQQILKRMSAREGHYMKAEMLQSQFAILEEPASAIVVDISLPVDEIVKTVSADIKNRLQI